MKKVYPSIIILLIFTHIILGISSIVAHSSVRSYSEFIKPSEVKIISNPKTPVPEPGKRRRLVFSEELTIGTGDDINSIFGNTIFFNVDEEGNIYVSDWDAKEIKKFNSNGKYLLSIGRMGQGPGEFQNLSIPRFDKNKNIYVTDIATRKISYFDKEGNFLNSIKIPSNFDNLYVNSKGKIIAYLQKRMHEEGLLKWGTTYGLYDNQFKIIKKFFTEELVARPPTGNNSRADFVSDILTQAAYRPQVKYALADDDFIYFGFSDKYEIKIYSPEGTLVKKIIRKYKPRKVTQKDIDYFIENIAEEDIRTFPRQLKKEIIRLIKYPKYKPPYQDFVIMENGWLFVIVELREGEYTICDLFDEEGTYIGHFKADISPDLLLFKNKKAYAMASVDDYKCVKRYSFKIQEY